MSTETRLEEASAAAGNSRPASAGVRLRIWPAVVISLAHLAAAYGFARFASTNIQSAIGLGGVPLIALLLLIVWWLAASRAPWRDRFFGLGVFLAAVALVLFTQKSVSMGGMLLAIAVPSLTNGLVAALVVTFWVRWPVRRWLLALFLLGCAGDRKSVV